MTTIKLGTEEVKLDPVALSFTEATLNQFLIRFSGLYCYFSEKHAVAQLLFNQAEDKYEIINLDKFRTYKEVGGSDQYCEAQAYVDPEAKEAREQMRQAKFNMQLLWAFLRSMDKAHEDAMQMGYNLRKELSSLYPNYVKRLEDVIPHSQ